MIYSEYINLSSISVHIIGNKINQDRIIMSEEALNLDYETKELLTNYFISSFKDEEYFHFAHIDDLRLNEIFVYSSAIFEDNNHFHQYSQKIAEYLYEKSEHPNIKSGELYVALFQDCILDDETIDAVGIFKSENKDTFIKLAQNDGSFNVHIEKGININKLDKGCLIFNTHKDDGYVVAVVDNTNKADAKYWVEDFLGVKPRQDKYFKTQNFMSVCRSFVTKQLPAEFEVSKADQAEILNRSVQYFKENDEFSMQDFTKTVLESPEVIESFQSYKERYQTERDIEIEDSFTISNDAVKKQARSFKSVIKLDKNFHIYVHGNRNMIEQGEDEKGRYYKVYYKEEY